MPGNVDSVLTTCPRLYDTGVAHVCNLGHKGGGKEDILGSQVSVYDWRVSLVKVEQSTSHIFQDIAFLGQGDVGNVFQEVIQAGLQSLHDQQRQLSPWEEAEPKELCDVRVPEAGHQLAFLLVLLNHLRHTLIFNIQEKLMYSLTSTDQTFVPHLNQVVHNFVLDILLYLPPLQTQKSQFPVFYQ